MAPAPAMAPSPMAATLGPRGPRGRKGPTGPTGISYCLAIAWVQHALCIYIFNIIYIMYLQCFFTFVVFEVGCFRGLLQPFQSR